MNKQKEQRIKFHFLFTALMLFAALLGGSVVVGFAVQQQTFLTGIDRFIYESISSLPRNAILDFLIWPINNNFLKVGFTGMPSFLIVMVALALGYVGLFRRSLFLYFLLSLFLGTLFVSVLFDVDNHFVFRERPFMSLPNTVNQDVQASLRDWTSFPSGHSRDTAMYATLIAAYIPQLRLVMVGVALFVAFSRVYLGVHFPTDVVSGLLIGFLAARVALFISREIQIIFEKQKGIEVAQKPKASLKDKVKE